MDNGDSPERCDKVSIRNLLKQVPFAVSSVRAFKTTGRHIRRHYVMLGTKDIVRFRCNICDHQTSFPRQRMAREEASCVHCGSTVRLRSVIHALSMELFGKSLSISEFPFRPDVVGIGLSDWEGYADRLKVKLSYNNTWYHREPYLDIMNVDPSQHGLYDFIISTEVFEHVPPPTLTAFRNATKLLKPGGVLILTVPYISGKTQEHFPLLHDFRIEGSNGKRSLVNRTVDGQEQTFENLTFHGGRGSTLEMRLFGDESLRQEIEETGLTAKVYADEYPAHGIVWIPYDAAKARYKGQDTPPWALRRACDALIP